MSENLPPGEVTVMDGIFLLDLPCKAQVKLGKIVSLELAEDIFISWDGNKAIVHRPGPKIKLVGDK